ncbi:MAG TPA: hypothetical protein VFT64_11275 [Rickettsiales bacterium]|nr:hypothetical protein [Rickettsiales bacterium]
MTLPPLILLEEYGGDWQCYLETAYAIFLETVVKGGLTFLDKPIRCAWNPSHDNKHFSFWHVISERAASGKEEDRIPDMRRCERITWIAHILNNIANSQEALCWENQRTSKRGEQTHTVLYLQKERYVIVLRNKEDCYQLITTYCVQREHKHKKLIQEYEESVDPRNDKGRP